MVAFVRFLRDLGALGQGIASLEQFFQAFPQQLVTAQGQTANTLIVRRAAGSTTATSSIRPFYNEAETLIRVTHQRFDYPNCAPHATQAWGDYRRWLAALLRMDDTSAEKVERAALAFVLEQLPSHSTAGSTAQPVERDFIRLLQEFDFAARKGEPKGSAFQGAVYAYVRADAPHLHLDVAKVGAGARRLQRVGDIDGWEGARLAFSAEVKHYRLKETDLGDLALFAAATSVRRALGIVVAASFEPPARTALRDQGLRTLDLENLQEIVDLWDPIKQRAAVAAFAYYVHHIEKRKPLMDRLDAFLRSFDASPSPQERSASNPPSE